VIVVFLSKEHLCQNMQYDKHQTKCIISYLRNLNDASMIDEYFSSITTVSNLAVTIPCTSQIRVSKSNLLNQFIYSKSQRNACASNALSSDERLRNFLLKKKAIESIKISWIGKTINWFSDKRSAALRAVNVEIKAIEVNTERSCRQRQLETLFESFFDNNTDEMISYDDVEEFCIKKELIDSEIIRENEFEFEVNPTNLQISARSCKQIIHELKTDVYEFIKHSDDPLSNCKVNELDSEQYFETLLKAEFLTKLNLSVDEREREKNKFVAKMLKISDNLAKIKKCLRN
jgi:hypothetical protein